jgi:hypothetical protein
MRILEKLFGVGHAAKDRVVAERRATFARTVDPALAKVRAGGAVTGGELEACRGVFAGYYEALAARHGTEDNTRFTEAHRADFYVEALKLSALGHPDHDAWPVMAGLRHGLWGPLRARAAAGDPWLSLCAIQPALLLAHVDAAKGLYARLAGDPFLAGLAITWANDAVMGFTAYNTPAASRAFLAAVGGSPPWSSAGADLTPARRWPLLASVYPFLSRDPRAGLADPRPAAVVRVQLERDWDVTDAASARQVLGWLQQEGHRAALAEALEGGAPPEGKRGRYFAKHREALAQKGILAWDLCRLVSVARAAHTLGLLDAGEAWGVVLEAGAALAAEYGSWEALGDSFILGMGFFNPDMAGEDDVTVAMVRWLQRDPLSPWRTVPFGAR